MSGTPLSTGQASIPQNAMNSAVQFRAYGSRKQYWDGVFVYDVETQKTRCLIPQGHYEIGAFALAGGRIILTACRQDQGKTLAQMHDLYAMDVDTGALTLLHSGELSFGDAIGTDVTHGGGCQFVAWEDAVYFLCCVEEHTELMRYPYHGEPETLLKVYGAINSFAMGENQIILAAVLDRLPRQSTPDSVPHHKPPGPPGTFLL